ncbi:MAG: S1 RNA-binding domain-containing protein [Anaerolineae bacterium]|nr:S1 RNA-binding domain-containing protein [Anaerolineae bacterium]
MKRAVDLENPHAEPDPLSAMLDEYVPPPPCHRGDVVKGIIVRVDPKTILIDIGNKCDAIVHPREMELLQPADLQRFKPGQTVHVYVLDSNENEDVILVSLAKADQESDWVHAQELLESGEPVELEVVDYNKGGVIVYLGQLRGFVPASQLLPSWRALQNSEDAEHRWEALVGKKLTLKVIEVTSSRNRLIFSQRGLGGEKQRRPNILGELEIGSVQHGVVSNIVEFGAFVNIRGVDGLLHISEISWQRVNHPSQVLHVGQELDVYVLDVDLERCRLSLSLKRLTPDPWVLMGERYAEGQVIDVRIVNLVPFGAFASPVDIPEVEGLIHLSELAEQPVQVGTICPARILSLRPRLRRVAFSLKGAVATATEPTEPTELPSEAEAAPASAENV